MGEPGAVWGNKLVAWDYSLSLSHQIMLSQARDALTHMIRHIDEVHGLFQESIIENSCLDPNLPGYLSDLCNQQAVAATILFDNTTRTKENASLKATRNERVALVKQRCSGLNLKILPDKQLRNRLAHIDEYLPAAMKKHDAGWAVDLAFLDRDSLNETVENPTGLLIEYCRCYCRVEDAILHLGHTISLQGLRDEANAILVAVFGLDPIPEPAERIKGPQEGVALR